MAAKKEMKIKPGVAYTKSGEKKISGSASVKAPSKATKLDAKSNLIDKVTKRYNVTAREARDIVTSAMSLAKSAAVPSSRFGSMTKNKGATLIKTAGDVAKQAGETYTAATKGKSGTTGIKVKTMSRSGSGLPSDVEYFQGKKRKQGSKK